MTSRVPMVSLERARELGDAMGMPARRTQSEAFRVLANNPGVARVAYSQLIQLLENDKFDPVGVSALTAVWFYILGNTEPALGKQIGA